MHSCWSPVPKCRPSFQQLALQLEALAHSLSPTPPLREPLHYVNLEDNETEMESGAGGRPSEEEAMLGAGTLSWSVPWQHGTEDGAADWLMVGSGAAHAIGGDYRYIIGPCGAPGEEGQQSGRAGMTREESASTLQEDVKEEDDDVIIHV